MASKREHLTGAAQVKGTMIQAHLNWIAKRGIDPATALAAHLPAEVAKLVSHSVLATSWVPLSSLIAVDRAIATVAKGNPDDVFRELGRFSATSNLSGIYAGFVSDEPHRFFEKQARLHDRFQNFGASAYKELGPRAGQMRLTKYTEYSPVSAWRPDILVEYWDNTNPATTLMPTYQGVRVENGVESALYVQHDTREEEYYDFKADPYQMDSAVGSHPAEVNRLNARMKTLAACRGSSCR